MAFFKIDANLAGGGSDTLEGPVVPSGQMMYITRLALRWYNAVPAVAPIGYVLDVPNNSGIAYVSGISASSYSTEVTFNPPYPIPGAGAQVLKLHNGDAAAILLLDCEGYIQ